MKGYLRISPVLAGVMMATGTVGAAGAQCVTTQDCKALGYTEASCSGGKGVKCPFGNGWYCGSGEVTPEQCSKLGFSYSCSGTGYAGGAGSACGGKYAQCKAVRNKLRTGLSETCTIAMVPLLVLKRRA